MHVHPNYHKKMFTFVSQNIKMKSNNINFDDKKSGFYKNEKIFNIDDIDVNKILVSKKNHILKIIRLYTLLDIMIMILLDHYA